MLTQNHALTILACVELGLGKGGPENEGGKRVSDSHAGLSYGGVRALFRLRIPGHKDNENLVMGVVRVRRTK
jgi:hypothetical protein